MNIDAAKLRMECLKLAQAHSVTPHSGVYSIVDEAKRLWEFVQGPDEAPAAKSDRSDDLPF
jgi:hypothetical protein